jgi:hypothetical protein
MLMSISFIILSLLVVACSSKPEEPTTVDETQPLEATDSPAPTAISATETPEPTAEPTVEPTATPIAAVDDVGDGMNCRTGG